MKKPRADETTSRIRTVRRQRGMTLDALAAATGLDKGHLSRLERGHKGPSVASLVQIAEALGVTVSHVLGHSAGRTRVSIVRARDRKPLFAPRTRSDSSYESLLSGRAGMEAFVMYPGTAAAGRERVRHGGDELIFVLSGEIELELASRTIALAQGDCAHFHGSVDHALRRKGRRAAAALIVITGR